MGKITYTVLLLVQLVGHGVLGGSGAGSDGGIGVLCDLYSKFSISLCVTTGATREAEVRNGQKHRRRSMLQKVLASCPPASTPVRRTFQEVLNV